MTECSVLCPPAIFRVEWLDEYFNRAIWQANVNDSCGYERLDTSVLREAIATFIAAFMPIHTLVKHPLEELEAFF